MFDYNWIQILAFFIIYCFIGWIIESTWVSLHSGKFINRGFLRGTWIPIYGSGAFVLLFVTKPVEDNIFLIFIFGMLGATILEYVTGVLMEALFKVRYWDYTDEKFNFQGHICLGNSLAWGFLAVVLVRFIHTFVESIVYAVSPSTLEVSVLIIVGIFIIDVTLSVKAALDIADIIEKMERGKEEAAQEIEKIHRRFDVYVAVANDVKEEFIEELEDRIHARSQQLRIRRTGIHDFYKRSMIKGNPTMISKRVSGSVEEIRAYLNGKIGKDDSKKK